MVLLSWNCNHFSKLNCGCLSDEKLRWPNGNFSYANSKYCNERIAGHWWEVQISTWMAYIDMCEVSLQLTTSLFGVENWTCQSPTHDETAISQSSDSWSWSLCHLKLQSKRTIICTYMWAGHQSNTEKTICGEHPIVNRNQIFFCIERKDKNVAELTIQQQQCVFINEKWAASFSIQQSSLFWGFNGFNIIMC